MIYKTKIDLAATGDRIDSLKDVATRVEGVELIVLFGSLATSKPHPLSDVDVAFRVADLDEEKRLRIWEETTDILKTDEVDVVYLNDDLPYRLKYEIAWNGRLLYEAREGLFADFRVSAAAMWIDFKPYADYQSRTFWERVRAEGFGK